jgi:hypothetical protein
VFTDRQADNDRFAPGEPGGVGHGETWAEWNFGSRKYIRKIKLRRFFTQPIRPWKLGLSGIAQLNIRLAGAAGSRRLPRYALAHQPAIFNLTINSRERKRAREWRQRSLSP